MEGLLRATSALFINFLAYVFRLIICFGLSLLAIHFLNEFYGDSIVIGATRYSADASSLKNASPKFSGFGAPFQIPVASHAQEQDPDWLKKAKARLAKERKKLAEKAKRETKFPSRPTTRNNKREDSISASAGVKTIKARMSAQKIRPILPEKNGLLQRGKASYYGKKWDGRKTANGEVFNHRKFTAAHKTLPFGIYVRVVRKDNGNSVVVRINDRGPYVKGRVIDLSSAAAKHIGMLQIGVSQVAVYKATVADYLKQFMD